MRKKSRALWQIAGGALVGAVCLWYTLRDVDSPTLAARLGAISWSWVALAVLGVVLVSTGKALRWSWLYPAAPLTPPFSAFFSILLIAQALNLLVPVRLGELARLGLMQEAGKPVGATLGTIAVEKSLDLLAVGIILLLIVPLGGVPGGVPGGAPAWLAAGAGQRALIGALALAGLLALLAVLRRPLLARLNRLPTPRVPVLRWVLERLSMLLRGFLDSLAGLDPRRVLQILGLTALVWFVSAAVIQALFTACDMPLGPQTAALLMVALMFSNLAPTPPAMIGVVGVVTGLVLAPFGLPTAQMIAYGIILNAVVVGPPVLIGGALAGQRIIRLLLVAPGERPLSRALGLSHSTTTVDER